MHFGSDDSGVDYRLRVAAYGVVLDDHDRLLVTWYNGADQPENACWSLPGGGMEFGEQPTDTIVREAYEETGYQVEVGPIVGTFTVNYPARDESTAFMGVRIIHRATVVGGQLGTTETGGTTDFAEWLALDDAKRDPRASELVRSAIAAIEADRTPRGS